MGTYLKTDQIIDKFNNSYSYNFYHRYKVNSYDNMFWGFVNLNHPCGTHNVNFLTRVKGWEYNFMSDIGVNYVAEMDQLREKYYN